jgi:DNA-binding protein HU-beta
VTKQELVDRIAKGAELTKAQAARALDEVLDGITDALRKGDSVSIVGFGTFLVRERQARVGRNPRTKEEIEIPAGKVPAFKAGKKLKDAVE